MIQPEPAGNRLEGLEKGILKGAGEGAILNINGVNVQMIGGRIMDGVVHIDSFVGL